ncbi:hypothetical protein CYY_006036 [Polysphondylium violaceum]|uniref:Type A von Willebrand factor domain-containing protein n=1 Tax=Polysphondylium violaceum TaxID=133409 RepID=A0A8J4PSE2_9MYCE|nr:hypothetical protein CYY_006036 [Polysphondylium violaceum]
MYAGLWTKNGEQILPSFISINAKVVDLAAQIVFRKTYSNINKYFSTLNTINNTKEEDATFKAFLNTSMGVLCGFEINLDGKKITSKVVSQQDAMRLFEKNQSTDIVKEAEFTNSDPNIEEDFFLCKINNLSQYKELEIIITYATEMSTQGEYLLMEFPTSLTTIRSSQYFESIDNNNTGSTAATTTTTPAPNTTTTGTNSLSLSSSSIQVDQKQGLLIEMDLEMPSKISEIISPSHAKSIQVEYYTHNTGKVTYKDSRSIEVVNQSDLVILVKLENPEKPFGFVEESADGSTALLIAFYPKLNDIQKQQSAIENELIFLVDCSESMAGYNMKHAKKALHMFLHSLPKDTLFNIISFGSSYQKLFPRSVKYDNERLQAATKYVENLKTETSGDTNMLSPLKDIYSVVPTCSRKIFLLTDGRVSNTGPITNLVRENAHNTSVFPIGMGEFVSRQLVYSIASAGSGVAELAIENETIESKVIRQLKRALQPAMSNIRVDWGTLSSNRQAPRDLRTLFLGDRLNIYNILDKGVKIVDDTVKLLANGPNGPVEFPVKIKQEYTKQGNLIHNLAAYNLIQDLQDQIFESNDQHEIDTIRQKIIDLGIKYGLATNYTSFFSVEQDEIDNLNNSINELNNNSNNSNSINNNTNNNVDSSVNVESNNVNNVSIPTELNNSTSPSKSNDKLPSISRLQPIESAMISLRGSASGIPTSGSSSGIPFYNPAAANTHINNHTINSAPIPTTGAANMTPLKMSALSKSSLRVDSPEFVPKSFASLNANSIPFVPGSPMKPAATTVTSPTTPLKPAVTSPVAETKPAVVTPSVAAVETKPVVAAVAEPKPAVVTPPVAAVETKPAPVAAVETKPAVSEPKPVAVTPAPVAAVETKPAAPVVEAKPVAEQPKPTPVVEAKPAVAAAKPVEPSVNSIQSTLANFGFQTNAPAKSAAVESKPATQVSTQSSSTAATTQADKKTPAVTNIMPQSASKRIYNYDYLLSFRDSNTKAPDSLKTTPIFSNGPTSGSGSGNKAHFGGKKGRGGFRGGDHGAQSNQPVTVPKKIFSQDVQGVHSEAFKTFKFNLNRITMDTYSNLIKNIDEIKVPDEECLTGISKILFEKAIVDQKYSAVYAILAGHLDSSYPQFGGISLKRAILNNCQEEFGKVHDRSTFDTLSKEDREEKEFMIKRRVLGNIKFIGELFKHGVLGEKITKQITTNLILNTEATLSEESIECLVKLINTIGKKIDEADKTTTDEYFRRIYNLSENSGVSSRGRFLLMDILDLRKNKWQTKAAALTKAKKEEAEKEERFIKQHGGSSGGRGDRDGRDSKRGGDDRRGDRRGDRGGDRDGDDRRGGRGDRGGDRDRPPRGGKSSIFDKKGSKEGGWETVKGAGSNNKGGSKTPKKGERDSAFGSGSPFGSSKGSPFRSSRDNVPNAPSSSSKKDEFTSPQRGSNLFSALEDDEYDRAPSKSNNNTNTNNKSSNTPTKSAAPVEPAKPEVDIEKMEDSVTLTLDEFVEMNDVDEAIECIKEIVCPPSHLGKLFNILISKSLEKKEKDRSKIIELFKQIISVKFFSDDNIKEGLKEILEIIEDIEVDLPFSSKFISHIIGICIESELLPLGYLEESYIHLVDTGKAEEMLKETFNGIVEASDQDRLVEIYEKTENLDILKLFKLKNRSVAYLEEFYQTNFPYLSHEKAIVTDSDKADQVIEHLLMIQNADGYWELSKKLAGTLNIPFSAMTKAESADSVPNTHPDIWATCLAYSFLEINCPDERDDLELILKKISSWLNSQYESETSPKETLAEVLLLSKRFLSEY